MVININQGNIQENITSEIITKLYNIAIDPNNTVTYTGNLYSPSGYASQVDYLNNTFSPELTITVPSNGLFISFEDPVIESIIKTLLGIGSDSGVTVNQAANATFTSSTFKDNTSITSFPEFGLFTKANGQNQPQSLFSGCSNLTYIDLSNVTYLNNSCFNGCSSLSINNQDIENVIVIGNDCFKGSNVSGDMTFSHLTSIGSSAFRNTRIQSIDFTGSTFTAVGASTFRGCSHLTKLVLPTTVTTIGNEWVVDIPRQITVEGTDNIANYGTANPEFRNPIIENPVKTGIANDLGSLFKVTGNSASSGMSLHSLYEPLRKNTPVGTFIPATNSKASLFWSSQSSSANANIGLYYLKDIETFGYMAFYGTTIDNLVINNVTPPTLTTTENSTQMGYTMYQDWGNVIFGPNSVIGTLWVPDSAVATYQADPLYSGLTIKGINTKTNGVDYDLPRYATYADWKTAEAAAVAQGGHAPQGLIEAWM